MNKPVGCSIPLICRLSLRFSHVSLDRVHVRGYWSNKLPGLSCNNVKRAQRVEVATSYLLPLSIGSMYVIIRNLSVP